MKQLKTILVLLFVVTVAFGDVHETLHRAQEKIQELKHMTQEFGHENVHTGQEKVQEGKNSVDETLEVVGHRAEELKDRSQSKFSKIVDSVKETLGGSGSIFDKAGDKISETTGDIGNTLNEKIHRGQEFGHENLHTGQEKFQEGRNTVDEALEKVGHRGAEFGTSAAHRVDESTSNIGDKIQDAVNGLKDSLHLYRSRGVSERLSDAFDRTIESLREAKNYLGDHIPGHEAKHHDTIKDKISNTVSDTYDNVKEGFSKVGDSIKSVIPGHREATFRDHLLNAAEDIKGHMPGHKEETLSNKFEHVFEDLKGGVSHMTENIKSHLPGQHEETTKEKISSTFDDLKEKAQQYIPGRPQKESMKDKILNVAEEVRDRATGPRDESFTQKLEHVIDDLKETIKSYIPGRGAEVSEPVPELESENKGWKDKIKRATGFANAQKLEGPVESNEQEEGKWKEIESGFVDRVKSKVGEIADSVRSHMPGHKEEPEAQPEPEPVQEEEPGFVDRMKSKVGGIADSIKSKIPGHSHEQPEVQPEPEPVQEEEPGFVDRMKSKIGGVADSIKGKFSGEGKEEQQPEEQQPEEELVKQGKLHDIIEKIASHLPGGERVKPIVENATKAAAESLHNSENQTLSEKLHAAANAVRDSIPGIRHHDDGIKGKVMDKVTDKVIHTAEKGSGVYTAGKVMDKVEHLYEKGKGKIPEKYAEGISGKLHSAYDYVSDKLGSLWGETEPVQGEKEL